MKRNWHIAQALIATVYLLTLLIPSMVFSQNLDNKIPKGELSTETSNSLPTKNTLKTNSANNLGNKIRASFPTSKYWLGYPDSQPELSIQIPPSPFTSLFLTIFVLMLLFFALCYKPLKKAQWL